MPVLQRVLLLPHSSNLNELSQELNGEDGFWLPYLVSLQQQFSKLTYLSSVPYASESPAAAATKSLQSCPTLCNPIDTAHQAPLSLGFSRQEHWSGLPFPSPMYESEK